MHIAVICLSPAKDGANNSCPMHAGEAMQALALAKFLASQENCTLICQKDSDIGRIAAESGLPCLFAGSALGFLRIWNWQRKHKAMRIIAAGPASLGLGHRIQRAGKNRHMDSLFLLEAPVSLRPKLLEHTDRVICGSEYIADLFKKLPYGPKQHKPDILVRAPGMDVARYDEGMPWQKGERLVLGMANSLMPESGALLVIRSMAALWHNLADWEARMFGSGPRYAEIMAEAEKMGVLSRLAILGDQPLNDASRQCHIWLAPGMADNEPPQTLWAGFASGLPVIASDSCLHNERILDSEAALMVDKENPQELAGAILKITHDNELREGLARHAFALRSQISLEGMARRVCQALWLA